MKFNLSVIGLLIIILLSLSSSVIADSRLSYKVKSGDNHTYEITKDYSTSNIKPVIFQETWQDGTKSNLTIAEGLVFTSTVCYVIGSDKNASVYTKTTINGKTSACIQSFNNFDYYQSHYIYGQLSNLFNPNNLPIIPITNNLSYYQYSGSTNIITTTPYLSIVATSYTINGNNLLVKTTGNTTPCFGNLCDSSSYKTLNLKTEININLSSGWYTNLSSTETFTNGSIYSEYKVIQFNTGTSNSSNLPGFGISALGMGFVIIIPFIIFKRKKLKI